MAPLHDEQAGEILGRYVEALKNAEDPATVNFVAITATETDELAPVMKTAAQVAQAMAAERRNESCREAVRQKFRVRAAALAREAAMAREAAARVSSAPAGGEDTRGIMGWLRLPQLVGGLGWACATVLAVMLLMPRAAPPRTPAPLPLTHSEVHNAVPALIRNQIPLERARLMWAHLAGCEACFGLYRKEWRAFHGMATLPPELMHRVAVVNTARWMDAG